jgi:diguanylate cyclase (GGDEF)-like protein/PAS domain S-box-containing protein
MPRPARPTSHTAQQLGELQQRYDALFARNPDPVYFMDLLGRITAANQACAEISGYTLDELVGRPASQLIAPEELHRSRKHFIAALRGVPQNYELTFVTRDGRRVELHVNNVPILAGEKVVGVYGIGKDVTLRRRLLDLTRLSATESVGEQVHMILAALREVLPYDSGGLYWIDQAAGVLRPAELVAANWVSSELDKFHIPIDKGVMGAVARNNVGELVNNAHLDPRAIYPEGAVVTCEHLVVVPVVVDGRPVGVFYVARRSDPPFSGPEFDIVQLFIGHAAAAIEKTHLFEQTRASEERFQHQALHDALTHLPNRVLLHDRLTQAIASAARSDESVALLVVDLDRFKEVNDTLGHQAGDRLLQEVSTRFRASVRASDTVARLGGDEFALVLPGADATTAVTAAGKLLAALNRPVRLDGWELPLGASIGIAAYPEHGANADTLLRRADIAMYAAKRARAGGHTVYSPDLDRDSSERLSLVAELRRAIAMDELTLHYQPQVECFSGQLVGVEALVRWWHPERGLMGPDKFVALAEQSGLVHDLTRWVLATALGQGHTLRRWLHELTLSVNLSGQDLLDAELPDFVNQQLVRWQFPPSQLTLEITESALLADNTRARVVLGRLRQMGVRVALDDFGTGYSSLSYLKDWPVDELKVDRSFVKNMIEDARDRSIVRAIVDLAHSLGLQVVAEGVETSAVLALLDELACDRAQGYLLSKPLPAAEFKRWLRSRGHGDALDLLAA